MCSLCTRVQVCRCGTRAGTRSCSRAGTRCALGVVLRAGTRCGAKGWWSQVIFGVVTLGCLSP